MHSGWFLCHTIPKISFVYTYTVCHPRFSSLFQFDLNWTHILKKPSLMLKITVKIISYFLPGLEGRGWYEWRLNTERPQLDRIYKLHEDKIPRPKKKRKRVYKLLQSGPECITNWSFISKHCVLGIEKCKSARLIHYSEAWLMVHFESDTISTPVIKIWRLDGCD